jgi:hypothetical protein
MNRQHKHQHEVKRLVNGLIAIAKAKLIAEIVKRFAERIKESATAAKSFSFEKAGLVSPYHRKDCTPPDMEYKEPGEYIVPVRSKVKIPALKLPD